MSKYKKEYEQYQKSVKSYFDMFDKIKFMVKQYHNIDELGFKDWIKSPQVSLSNKIPLDLFKDNKIEFIFERYRSLLKY
jgi:formiminotetrahydrofolate cyclodeaminase